MADYFPQAIPWWRSRVIIGALISIAGKVLVATGLISSIAPADADALADTVVLLASGVGDLIAIGARLRQKAAPAITATTPSPHNYAWAAILLLPLTLALMACQTIPPSAPHLDEAAMIGLALQSAPEADRPELVLVVAAEVGARFRCPANATEVGLLEGIRVGFDALKRNQLSQISRDIVDGLRIATNEACGISPG